MRKRAVALAAVVIGGLFGAPQATAQTFTPSTEAVSVETRFGHIYAEVTYPTKNGKPVKGPSVLTVSPYSALGRTNPAIDWVEEGYVHVWADLLGTGNSGGCWDYGGKRERRSTYELIEWIADQPWSNGKVGMVGGSYDGTTAWGAAVEDPPHLTTIVPQAAIARWYDYSYAGGIRYALNNETPTEEGFTTPLVFDSGIAIPPPLDVDDPNWADKVASTIAPCEELEHTQRGYDDTPDYDDFWIERDHLKMSDKIDIPVLITHNWGDWNVKPDGAYWMYQALKERSGAETVFYAGSRWQGHEPVGGDYPATLKRWFDHYLMGKGRGTTGLPSYISQVADYGGHGKPTTGEPRVRNVVLYAQEGFKQNDADTNWKLLPERYRGNPFMEPTEASWPIDAPNAETHANHHARENHEWQYFESPALAKDVRIFGEIKVQLYSEVDRSWVTLIPVVLDIKHDCHKRAGNVHVVSAECMQQSAPSSEATPRSVIPVTRGFLDSRYRNGLHKQIPVDPGRAFAATVEMKPVDYIFRKHHSIALNIFSSNVEWAVHKFPDPGSIDAGCFQEAILGKVTDPANGPNPGLCAEIRLLFETNKVRVVLPVVDGPRNGGDLFDYKHDHGSNNILDELPLP